MATLLLWLWCKRLKRGAVCLIDFSIAESFASMWPAALRQRMIFRTWWGSLGQLSQRSQNRVCPSSVGKWSPCRREQLLLLHTWVSYLLMIWQYKRQSKLINISNPFFFLISLFSYWKLLYFPTLKYCTELSVFLCTLSCSKYGSVLLDNSR